MFKKDTALSFPDTEDKPTESTSPTPTPEETWWGDFQATMSLYQLEEMQKLAIEGSTDEEIMRHFKSKHTPKEEFWLSFVQYAEAERKKLDRENRAQRKQERQLEAARELAYAPPEDLWQDQFSPNE